MVYLMAQCCVQMRGLTPRVFESLFQRIAELDKEAVQTPCCSICPLLISCLSQKT